MLRMLRKALDKITEMKHLQESKKHGMHACCFPCFVVVYFVSVICAVDIWKWCLPQNGHENHILSVVGGVLFGCQHLLFMLVTTN